MIHGGLATIADQYQAWLTTGAVFLAVLGLVYGLGRYLVVPPLVRFTRSRNPENPTLVDAVRTYAKVLAFVVALPVATTAAGFGRYVAGSAVIVAAATLALGVAGQDVIGNLVSGLFLVADREFNVGDLIQWDGKEGRVERIALRVTRVRTPNGEIITVPNTQLATHAIREPFAWKRYRLQEPLQIAYGEPLDRAQEILEQAALDDDRVLEDPEPSVVVTGLEGDSIDVATRFWVGDPEAVSIPRVRTAFLSRAEERLREAGIRVAPPAGRELSGSIDVEGSPPADGGEGREDGVSEETEGDPGTGTERE